MLKGKVAVVTGGGSGIGQATCKLFAEEGASVVVLDINEDAAAGTVAMLSGNNHLPLKVDVSKSKDIDSGMAQIKKKYSTPPSVCVNCAGVAGSLVNILELSELELNKILDINFKGTVMMTQAVCRELVAANKEGSVVNISSVAALAGMPDTAVYSATKAAVDLFSRCVAGEMAKHKIRVNTVQPGLVSTPLAESIPMEIMLKVAPKGAIDDPADPREIAQVILFLASDKASYVSGSAFKASGGYY